MANPRKSAKPARGRPVGGGDATAREALLDAAVGLVAERGAAATRSADVAERAGVTPAMVHYYFRSREQLLDAVVDERLARFATTVFAAPVPDADASTMITTIVRRLFAAAATMPWMPPIWIREIVSEGGTLRERMLRHFPMAAVAVLTETVARDQKRGRIPAGVDARLAFLSISGAVMLPLALRSVWGRIPALAELTTAQLEQHALTVLTAGLAPVPRPRRSR